MKRTRIVRRGWVVLAVGVALCSLVHAAKPTSDYVDVLTTTFEKRNAESPLMRVAKTAELVFPLPHATKSIRTPTRQEKGAGPPKGKSTPDYVWQRHDWKPKYADYLAQRRKGTDLESTYKLIDWCEANNLPECAAYELRRLIYDRFMMMRDRDYALQNKRYLPYAEELVPRYTFPLPVAGEWMVLADSTGHHRGHPGANFAADLVMVKKGAMASGDGRKLTDYYAFGQPVYAQADGIVTVVKNDKPDNEVGRMGAGVAEANTLMIDYGDGIHVLLGHLQKGSITVRVGDRVRPGQTVAKVGNSGMSFMPHLHFTLCDPSHFSIPGIFRFEVRDKGEKEWKQVDAQLRTGMFIRTLENWPPVAVKK